MSSAVGAQEVIPGEFLVKFKGAVGSAVARNKVNQKAQFKSAVPALGLFHIKQKSGLDGEIDLESLKSDPDVEYMEPNYVLRKVQQDPGQHFEKLSYEQVMEDIQVKRQAAGLEALASASGTYTQTLANVQVEQAWAASAPYASGNRPIVAVIDTGLDSNHRVFSQSGALWINPGEIPGNGVDDDFNGFVDDVKGWNFISNTSNFFDDEDHGTHVAGIVLGATQDIFQTTMASAKIRLMPLKFLDANGSGSSANAILAMYYAVNNGAKVINNSWGGTSYSIALHDAMTYAYNNGVLVVSAAGNSAKNNDLYGMYPANYDVPSNLSVAATTDYDYIASFSNYGTNKVHLGSPGVYVVSTLPSGSTNSLYGYMSGTSMAAPFVSGLAALAFREAPLLTGYQMKNILLSKSLAISQLSGKVKNSSRVNALAAVQEAKVQASTSASQPVYSAVYEAEPSRSPASASSPAQLGGAGCGLVRSVGSLSQEPKGLPKQFGVLTFLLVVPVLLWLFFAHFGAEPRRRYERYKLESVVSLKVGDREIQGRMQTISLGGMSFCAQDILEKGGRIQINIQSPDGKEMFQTEGQIVWSVENKSYGVKFINAQESLLQQIRSWCMGLS
jgi:subtilisin family serine protease